MAYHISEISGGAYKTAIENIINYVNKFLGLNWNYSDNWTNAHWLAVDMKIRFDCNGEFA